MVKNKFFKTLLIFSILSIQINSVLAQAEEQKIPIGKELSDTLYKEFQARNFENLKRLPLSAAAFENFAYNIQIDFPSKIASEQSEDFIIAATQEDLFGHKNFFIPLLKFAESGNFKFNLIFLFSAGDKRRVGENEKTTGTETFCKSIEGAQNKHAVILDFSARKKTYVTPGGAGEVSPFYLTKAFCNTLDENSIDYTLSGGIYLSLYNLGILKSNFRISAFLSRGIPAIMLSMLSESTSHNAELKSIENFLERIELLDNSKWSRHYIPLKIASRHFWITESQILIIIMIFTALCLLILSDFTFLFRRRSRRLVEIKMRALKSNYLILFTAIVLALSLFAGQGIAQIFQKMKVRNFMLLFFIKLCVPFFIVSFLYPIEIKLHKNLPPYIYEYILSISALLNIFIFTILDISLFILFALEYLILALSRTVKRTLLLYLFMILFLLPFIPLVYAILLYSDGKKIYEIVFCSFGENIILSFAFVPLCLLWLRVLARAKLKAKSTKKIVGLYVAFSAISLSGIGIIATISITLLNQFFFKNVEFSRPLAQVEDTNENRFANVSIQDTEYYGGKIRKIELSSTKEVERYAIYVEGQTANPVYFSIYETTSEDGRTEFLLPENPPKNLTVLYTPDSSENSIITVEAYFLENKVQEQSHRALCKRETHIFDISGYDISERKIQ